MRDDYSSNNGECLVANKIAISPRNSKLSSLSLPYPLPLSFSLSLAVSPRLGKRGLREIGSRSREDKFIDQRRRIILAARAAIRQPEIYTRGDPLQFLNRFIRGGIRRLYSS